jgi:hypothetical protein
MKHPVSQELKPLSGNSRVLKKFKQKAEDHGESQPNLPLSSNPWIAIQLQRIVDQLDED